MAEHLNRLGHDRARNFADRLVRGQTYQQIGDAWGLTRERVRQILVSRYGQDQLRDLQQQGQAYRQQRRLGAIAEAWAGGCRSIIDIARVSGLSPGYVRHNIRYVIDDQQLLEGRRRCRYYRRPDRSQAAAAAIADLQRVAARSSIAQGEELTAKHYDRSRLPGEASAQTVTLRLGKWRTAVEAAGYRCASVKGRGPKYSEEDLMQAIASVAEELGYLPSIAEYQSNRADDSPSADLLRRRLGSWGDALDAYQGWRQHHD